MQYDIEVGGRTRHVRVERTGAGFAVSFDDRTWRVNAARIDAHMLSLLIDRVWLDDTAASHEIVLAPDPMSGGMTARVGATPVPVALATRRRWGTAVDAGAAGSGPQKVKAPMPGKIVRVLVAPGDIVHPRQSLVVVEAMKMENELRAGREGTVAEVHAREGQSVDAGALLIVIQ